ncbi:MAG: pyridoxal phosphate-dependent aminotransferase [Propionibacteriaceae bacterium]|jgi:aspartate/methionine/tyrosine aminotransferase|nr:pyridoxal phosphate-dependent aminotransferase [Propionibacteriaceae bacterium]
MTLSSRLPDFPWDSLADATKLARSHHDGIVDLSVGTPVDPTPEVAQHALAAASDAHGYPTVWGTPALRAAIISYLSRRWAAAPLSDENVLPVIGTKEIVGWLPTLLGLGPGDSVVIPKLAYPTYEVGARLVGANVICADSPAEVAEALALRAGDTGILTAGAPASGTPTSGTPKLIWINYPANPHGVIASPSVLREWIEYARSVGAVLASDECYGEFGWTAEPLSVLDASLNGGDVTGLLAVHSVSKHSNMAGYRAGFVAGDNAVIQELLGLRKHLGMMVPAPVQAALAAVLATDEHVIAQRQRYLARRNILRPALESAGFTIEHSDGGLYLWATRAESGRDSVAWLAGRGILVAPGDFYGALGANYIRVALTATDERIAAAASRLTER